jgi:hypothetical protein
MYRLVVTVRKPPQVLLPIGDIKVKASGLDIFGLFLKYELLRFVLEVNSCAELIDNPKLNLLLEIPIRIFHLILVIFYLFGINIF